MDFRLSSLSFGLRAILLATCGSGCAAYEWPVLWPYEEKTVRYRDPSQLPPARVPDVPPPATVVDPTPIGEPMRLSLDESIRIALSNAEVLRVLTGVAASSSGRTVYDAAITNTTIDQRKAIFDPTLGINNTLTQVERAQGALDPFDPTGGLLRDSRTDGYTFDLGLSKRNALGGKLDIGYDLNRTQVGPFRRVLEPQTASNVELGYVQPLLQGGGVGPNIAPIVIARLETERSFFQEKAAVQDTLRGVVAAYWNLVFSRTNVWARQQQVDQGEQALERAEARQRAELGDIGDVAQTRLALANFRANLITAEADLLQREAALRNILGLPPSSNRIIPTTPPTTAEIDFDWMSVLSLAQQQRPDIIELKLIIEADSEQLVIADNQALPQLDGVAQYRWNGFEGRTLAGEQLTSDLGETADWTLGVNFSVPLGLRAGRAELRRRELLLARDRANLQQGIHNAAHQLALAIRNIDQYHAEYLAFRETREAARINLDLQLAEYRVGRTIFLNVLQAITDWGNAVSSEAQALTQYNTALVDLERETGTILDTHGVRFFEERYRSIGPLGRCFDEECYPYQVEPGPNADRYPSGNRPAEEFFNLEDPLGNPQPKRSRLLDVEPSIEIPPLPNLDAASDNPFSVPPTEARRPEAFDPPLGDPFIPREETFPEETRPEAFELPPG